MNWSSRAVVLVATPAGMPILLKFADSISLFIGAMQGDDIELEYP
jgi:hypothetical protein